MTDFAYRFRTIDALLGDREELSKQVVYFASLQQLNDPMEGFRDVIWQGDGILWRNLFRNYIRTFHAAHGLASLFHDLPIQKWMTGALDVAFHPPEAPIKAELDKVAEVFLDRTAVRRLAAALADRPYPVRRHELLFVLRLLHQIAMQVSAEAQAARAGPKVLNLPPDWVQQATTNLGNFTAAPAVPPDFAEELYGAGEVVNLQVQLINAASGLKRPPAALFLVADFAPRFMDALIAMPYPDWHVASFVESPDNAAMWSAYAENHTGACLKFRTGRSSTGRRTLFLNHQRRWRAKKDGQLEETRSFVPMEFSPIHYDGGYPEIPFFTSLGQLPIPDLNRRWYSEDGVLSPAAGALMGDATQWREDYWKRFEGCVNRKTPHWAHERELRLVLHSSMEPFGTPESRCLNYRFEDLAGVVFGVRTSATDKVRILKVIQEKCRIEGRVDFEFLQATYSHRSHDIETKPLGLIKGNGVGSL